MSKLPSSLKHSAYAEATIAALIIFLLFLPSDQFPKPFTSFNLSDTSFICLTKTSSSHSNNDIAPISGYPYPSILQLLVSKSFFYS